MAHGQQEFSRAIEAAPFKDPRIPIIGNVSARPLTTAAEVRTDLHAQLTSRVRWVESIQWAKSQGVSHYIEIGSGSVLTGLIKRIDEQAACTAVGNPSDFEKL
jgi:[acyl-carrier-protein] S-malonyltransferase